MLRSRVTRPCYTSHTIEDGCVVWAKGVFQRPRVRADGDGAAGGGPSLIRYPPATMDAAPIQYAGTENGVKIASWTLGDGEPVVLVHSHAASRWRLA